MRSKRKLLLTAAFTALLGIGAFVGLKAGDSKKAVNVNAASNVTLKGSFDDWGSGRAFSDDDGDGVWTLSTTLDDLYQFKIVVGSEWCGGGVQDTSDDLTSYVISSNTDGGNMWFLHTGTFDMQVDTNNSNKLKVTGGFADGFAGASLVGSMNSWTKNTSGYVFADQGDGVWTLNNISLSSGDTFKIIADNGSDNWCGFNCLNSEDSFTSTYFSYSGNGDDKNISVNLKGTYSFSFLRNLKGNYGLLTISGEIDKVTVSLKVTFSSAVDDWVDIYLPGSFNDWSESALMTPNAARTEFTLENLEAIPVAHKYKVIACYHSSGFSWTTYIDSENQDLTILETWDDSTQTIRSNLAKPDMPQQYVAEGAVVTLTMSSRVDEHIKMYFVSTLTGWGTDATKLASAVMIPNSGRTAFTWAFPSGTPVGYPQFQIVAMYDNGGQTSASYDYKVYSKDGGNETITLDTTTLNYAYASSYDLSELGAIAFSREFTSSMETICGTTSSAWSQDHSGTALNNTWSTYETAFESLTEGAVTSFSSSSNSYVAQARSLYIHCVTRYGLSTWEDAPHASRINLTGILVNGSPATIIVIAISSIAVAGAVGGYFLFRKKKEN